MFTAFIAAAYQANTEFVTGDDLAERIATFDKTHLEYTVTGDTIVAKVTPTVNNLGTFALDFEFARCQAHTERHRLVCL